MFAADLGRIAHQSCERFDVRGLAAPVAGKNPLGVRVPAGIHAGIIIKMDSGLSQAYFQSPKCLSQHSSLPGLILGVAKNGPLGKTFHLPSHDRNNLGIGDADDPSLFGLRLFGLEDPFHPLPVILNLLSREACVLATVSGTGADANADGSGQRLLAPCIAFLLLLRSYVGHSTLRAWNLVTLDGISFNQSPLHSKVEGTLHCLNVRFDSTIPVFVGGDPCVDVSPFQLVHEHGSVSLVDAVALHLPFQFGRECLCSGTAGLVAIAGRKSKAKIEEAVSSHGMCLVRTARIEVFEVRQAHIQNGCLRDDCNLSLSVQQEAGMSSLHFIAGGILFLDVLPVFVAEGNLAGSVQSVPAPPLAKEVSPFTAPSLAASS